MKQKNKQEDKRRTGLLLWPERICIAVFLSRTTLLMSHERKAAGALAKWLMHFDWICYMHSDTAGQEILPLHDSTGSPIEGSDCQAGTAALIFVKSFCTFSWRQ